MNIVKYIRQNTGVPGMLVYCMSEKEVLQWLKTKIANAVEDYEIPLMNTIGQPNRFVEVCEDIANHVCDGVKDEK